MQKFGKVEFDNIEFMSKFKYWNYWESFIIDFVLNDFYYSPNGKENKVFSEIASSIDKHIEDLRKI